MQLGPLASFLLQKGSMKPHLAEIGRSYPRMIAERKPLRPVQIAVVRPPVKVTKPISFGEPRLAPMRAR